MNEKDNKSIEISKIAQNMAIFKDTGFNYLYQKTEKITTAIYLITNFLSSNEPIKWQIRSSVMQLLRDMMSLGTVSMSSRTGLVRKISIDLFSTHSLFNIAFQSGFISQMNYSLLNEELENLISFFNEYNADQLSTESRLFEEKDFKVNLPKGQVNRRDFNIKDEGNKMDMSVKDIKDRYKRQGSNVLNKRGNNKERRDKILEILKNKNNVSVKDISKEVTDCSEKTLQRELIAMVEEGVIVKEGERRWSRYSLKA